jgi:hypothetical protein
LNYTTPKTDWAAGDNPGPSDFNRIEKNIEINRLSIQYIPGISGSYSMIHDYYSDKASFEIKLPSYNVTATVITELDITGDGLVRLRFGTNYSTFVSPNKYVINVTGSVSAVLYIQIMVTNNAVTAALNPIVHVIIL